MLVLKRDIADIIIIEYPNGNKVTIEVLNVNGIQVRIGLEAPKDINILRSELLGKLPN